MRDRVSTQVITSGPGLGAIRYAEYDSAGTFVQYRYLLPADEPTVVGTPFNKATLLTDATAIMINGLSSDPTVNEALAGIVVMTNALMTERTSWGEFIRNRTDINIISALGRV